MRRYSIRNHMLRRLGVSIKSVVEGCLGAYRYLGFSVEGLTVLVKGRYGYFVGWSNLVSLVSLIHVCRYIDVIWCRCKIPEMGDKFSFGDDPEVSRQTRLSLFQICRSFRLDQLVIVGRGYRCLIYFLAYLPVGSSVNRLGSRPGGKYMHEVESITISFNDLDFFEHTQIRI